MKRITDPTFKYTKAIDTDIRKTFRKWKTQQVGSGKTKLKESESASSISPLKNAGKKA